MKRTKRKMIMACQLRVGDVFVGSTGKRFEVTEIVDQGTEYWLRVEGHDKQIVMPWHQQVRVELTGAPK